jgi:response regulator RpfG family c-di-GMP phosphodiesterase
MADESSSPKRVLLVVDDEPLNRDILKRLFYADYDIVEADHGLDAQEVLEKRTVDVIICDHLMPGMTGAELVRLARSRWPTTVCLLLTGYDDDPMVTMANKEGAIFEIVAKPWQIAQMKEAVGRAVAERRKRQGA